jgi:hypothetical protein
MTPDRKWPRPCPTCGEPFWSTAHSVCDWCWVYRDKGASRSDKPTPTDWSGFLRLGGAA